MNDRDEMDYFWIGAAIFFGLIIGFGTYAVLSEGLERARLKDAAEADEAEKSERLQALLRAIDEEEQRLKEEDELDVLFTPWDEAVENREPDQCPICLEFGHLRENDGAVWCDDCGLTFPCEENEDDL